MREIILCAQVNYKKAMGEMSQIVANYVNDSKYVMKPFKLT